MMEQVKWKKIMYDLPKYLLVALVIIIISLLFPNNSRFKYEYRLNQIWGYDDIIAPFDFALLKTQNEIALEKIEIVSKFTPFYQVDKKRSDDAFRNFERIFIEKLDVARKSSMYNHVLVHSDKYQKEGLNLFKSVYASGVTQLDSIHTNLPPTTLINIVDGNTNSKTTKQTLVTLREAMDLLTDGLFSSGLPEADFLLSVFEESLIPDITYSKKISEKFLNSALNDIADNRGLISQGETIIRKGETINPEKYQELESYKAEFISRSGAGSNTYVFIGYLILTTLIIGVLLLFLMFHSPAVYNSFFKMLAIFIWPVIFSILVFLIEGVSDLSTYLIPFCIVPIVINHFFNARLALFVHIVIVLIASFLSSLGYEFTFLQILAGIVAIFANLKSGSLTGFFRAMIYIFLTYTIGFLGLNLIQEGGLSNIEWNTCGWAFLNAILTMLAYPLVPLLEKVFGFTTRITLTEISDMNQPLLKELLLKAPGTLQHSLQVANLSEAAANAVNADAMLVKVAALYHDIGKIKQPYFYIENQKGDNLHDTISDLESAKIIIDHVIEGVKMAKKAGLPKVIIDFINTHHGTTRVEYFYRNHKNDHPDKEIDESFFTYPGPSPFTKEQTILMMADSIEAASKSLKNPTGDDIGTLVDNIIKGKIANGQFLNSPLSFEELEICKKVFKTTLWSIHHVRIQYPELDKK
jgi:putative nucleotidyltransferase with HDIG domain